MPSAPPNHHRRSIRLPGYDYSQPGEYFITLCTHQHRPLFGEIIGDEMKLNSLGKIAYREWFKTSTLRHYIHLEENEFVVMPNHIHGIIHILDDESTVPVVGALRRSAPTEQGQALTQPNKFDSTEHSINVPPQSLPAIIRAYKSAVTYAINHLMPSPHLPIWQRNYYEHIITTEKEYIQIEAYIQNNPANWFLDVEYKNYIKNNPLIK